MHMIRKIIIIKKKLNPQHRSCLMQYRQIKMKYFLTQIFSLIILVLKFHLKWTFHLCLKISHPKTILFK